MARPRKSSFYHTRWNQVGINQAVAADILGVTVEDVERFDIEGAPVMAERLLLLWDKKYINHEGWDGFMFSRGILRWKNRRWSPKTLLLWIDQAEEISRLENELRRFKSWSGLLTCFWSKVNTLL